MCDPAAYDLIQRLRDDLIDTFSEEWGIKTPMPNRIGLLVDADAYLNTTSKSAVGPSNEELLAVAGTIPNEQVYCPDGLPSDWVPGEYIVTPEGLTLFARAVLARWGHQPPPPIPLSERLPTEADQMLLERIKEYIEQMEVRVEGEWGNCRELDQLIADRSMPDLYFQVTELLARWSNHPSHPPSPIEK